MISEKFKSKIFVKDNKSIKSHCMNPVEYKKMLKETIIKQYKKALNI